MDQTIYSAMQTGEPLMRYKKTINGKVNVHALNPYSGNPEFLILEGVDELSYIDLWDQKQIVFFERMNKKHIDAGRLVKTAVAVVSSYSPNVITDEEIDDLLSSPFLKLQKRVEKFTEVPPIMRLMTRARELEKSEKIIKFLESSAARLQLE